MTQTEFQLFIGVDVKLRNCHYFILDSKLTIFGSGWLEGDSNKEICERFSGLLNVIEKKGFGQIAVGIDSPRLPLLTPRNHFWDGKRRRWRARNEREQGHGRHCEVVLKALKIANPQWTTIRENSHAWMVLGFALFSCLEDRAGIFEVFPSASYWILKNRLHPRVTIDFSNFVHGPKDMIDACVSALTVFEFLQGRGSEVGGGDGLGSIILPGPLPVNSTHPLLQWPN